MACVPLEVGSSVGLCDLVSPDLPSFRVPIGSVGHPNADVLKVIIEALAMLLKSHPKQALWQLSSLCLSTSSNRRQVGDQIRRKIPFPTLPESQGSHNDAGPCDGQLLCP